MSLTKSSPAYARNMDQVFDEERDRRDYDADYADWRYHMDKERIQQMEHDKALEAPNVHDKIGTKEDVFGIIGRVFNPSK